MLIDPKYGPKLCMKRPRGIWEYKLGDDPFRPDFNKCPAARRAVALFADVKAGDVLFVPGSYHHAARNLENSVGVSQNFLTPYDYPSVVESTFGYAAKRVKKERPSEQSADVTMEFLAMRDMFALLPDTGLFDSSDAGKQWWNATEAKAEAYERVMRHMESVVKTALDPMKVASRLAYFVNRRTVTAALKAVHAWDCLGANGGQDIILQPPVDAEAVAFEMLERLERVLALPADVSCQYIYQAFVDEVQSRSLPGAMCDAIASKGAQTNTWCQR